MKDDDLELRGGNLINELIYKIKNSHSYYNTSFYVCHLELSLWRIFSGITWSGTPFYIETLCHETKNLIKESSLTQEEILQYVANSQENTSYFFVSQSVLLYGTSSKLNDIDRYLIASKEAKLPNSIVIDEDILSCMVTCFVLDCNRFKCFNLKEINTQEKFAYPITDYKLTKIDAVDFRQSGFIYDDKYYLYNIFINRKPIKALDLMPGAFQLITENINLQEADFYMRLDERLAIPLENADISHRSVSAKFRGPTFRFDRTNLERVKNRIVHYDPETFNKLLMVVKKDYDKILDEEFWHVELEQLPYFNRSDNKNYVITTFVHAKYYIKRRCFRHIDFIKNQYPFEEYCDKQEDHSNNSIQVDYYTTKECHYKIWCVENIDITELVWYKLVSISLSENYRVLFDEMLEKSMI